MTLDQIKTALGDLGVHPEATTRDGEDCVRCPTSNWGLVSDFPSLGKLNLPKPQISGLYAYWMPTA